MQLKTEIINAAGRNGRIILKCITKIKLNMKTFYMVFVTGQNSPVYTHETFVSAKNEAVRLCRMVGKRAFVLKSISAYERPEEFKETFLEDEHENLPF